jgi:hypothetical protein
MKNVQLPDDLQATIEQYVAVQVDDGYSHSLRPDMVSRRVLEQSVLQSI